MVIPVISFLSSIVFKIFQDYILNMASSVPGLSHYIIKYNVGNLGACFILLFLESGYQHLGGFISFNFFYLSAESDF